MFNMANNVLSKDHNVFIKGNEEAYNIFLEDMDDIFKNHNFEDISDINKLLLDTTIKKHRLTGDNVGDDGTDTDVNNNINNDNDNSENKVEKSGFIEKDSNEIMEKSLSELMKERDKEIKIDENKGGINTPSTTTTTCTTNTTIRTCTML